MQVLLGVPEAVSLLIGVGFCIFAVSNQKGGYSKQPVATTTISVNVTFFDRCETTTHRQYGGDCTGLDKARPA
jgi:hypothetical protein